MHFPPFPPFPPFLPSYDDSYERILHEIETDIRLGELEDQLRHMRQERERAEFLRQHQEWKERTRRAFVLVASELTQRDCSSLTDEELLQLFRYLRETYERKANDTEEEIEDPDWIDKELQKEDDTGPITDPIVLSWLRETVLRIQEEIDAQEKGQSKTPEDVHDTD